MIILQLVCLSVVAIAFAEEEAAKKPLLLPALGYPGFGYGYGALPYAAAPALAAPIQVEAPEITLVCIVKLPHGRH